MKRRFLILTVIMFFVLPVLGQACETSAPMPTGEFSEGVVSKIRMMNGDGPDSEVVHTIYLDSYRNVATGQTGTCRHFYVLSSTYTPLLTPGELSSIVDAHIQTEIVKVLKTAFALNLHIQGSVRSNVWLTQFSPSMARDDYLSYSKKP